MNNSQYFYFSCIFYLLSYTNGKWEIEESLIMSNRKEVDVDSEFAYQLFCLNAIFCKLLLYVKQSIILFICVVFLEG